jgi:hypothetical protein
MKIRTRKLRNQLFPRSVLAIGVLASASLAACSHRDEPDAKVLGAAMQTYLAQRGDLCLAKSEWPIDLTQHEIDVGARNALQMPVLERLGLVESTVAEVDVDDEGTTHRMKVRRYSLTDAGRKFYVKHDAGAGSRGKAAQSDFCAAHLSLDKIVNWSLTQNGSQRQAVVTYTYHVDAAPWTKDAEVQKVFPVVAGVIRGAGTAQLQEAFALGDAGWTAVDLQGS